MYFCWNWLKYYHGSILIWVFAGIWVLTCLMICKIWVTSFFKLINGNFKIKFQFRTKHKFSYVRIHQSQNSSFHENPIISGYEIFVSAQNIWMYISHRKKSSLSFGLFCNLNFNVILLIKVICSYIILALLIFMEIPKKYLRWILFWLI